MTIGLAGAARTGKTTLAKAIAERTTLTYHDASVTQLMREAGFNAVGALSIDDRITAQEKLLEFYLRELRKQPGPVVTDRTPVDMIGYMLGEVTMHNTSPELGRRIQSYVESCIRATEQNFDTVIVVRPLPFYAPDPNKPAPSQAYQSQTQFLIEGALRQSRHIRWATIWATDLEERITDALEVLSERFNQLNQERIANPLH